MELLVNITNGQKCIHHLPKLQKKRDLIILPMFFEAIAVGRKTT